MEKLFGYNLNDYQKPSEVDSLSIIFETLKVQHCFDYQSIDHPNKMIYFDQKTNKKRVFYYKNNDDIEQIVKIVSNK
jgi:hypothetical protein